MHSFYPEKANDDKRLFSSPIYKDFVNARRKVQLLYNIIIY